MRVAVLTCTRDRLDYTAHCFQTLEENAGCDYDHFVFDQGSTDGTQHWLREMEITCHLSPKNVGIHAGWNALLDLAGVYDAYVTFDNDCEVLRHGTLAVACQLAVEHRYILSPTVLGLDHPPQPTGEAVLSGEQIDLFPTPGGIFRVLPWQFAHEFRFHEGMPMWGGDERWVGHQAALRGFGVGYLRHWQVNHYETTQGQQRRHPDYFERKFQEMAV